MNTIAVRLAIVLGAGLAVTAILVSLLGVDAGPSSTGCGQWFSPTLSDAEVRSQVEQSREAIGDDPLGGSSELDSLKGQLAAATVDMVRTHAECKEALNDRRMWALILAGLALVVPWALIFILRGHFGRDRS